MAKGELSYKYQRLRERLRTVVKSGELAGKLPGERELARRYLANAKTINKALNDLAMDGLILRHVGRDTFVAGDNGGNGKTLAGASRKFAWLAPGRIDDADLESVFGMTRSLLADQGHRIERFDSELDGAGELPESALSPGALREVDGAVVYLARPSRGFLANLRRRHLSVVLINNYHDEIRLPTVLCDHAHGAYAICEQCIQMGHHRIQFVARSQSLPAASAAERGYRAAMSRYGLKSLPGLLIGPDTQWANVLAGENRPTALICLSGRVARRACDGMTSIGLRVAIDVSVGVISEPGETLAKARQLSAYEVDLTSMLRWASELVMQGSSNHEPPMVIVPGKYVDRHSICPPPGDVAQLPSPNCEATI